jgi:hypothetical protein
MSTLATNNIKISYVFKTKAQTDFEEQILVMNPLTVERLKSQLAMGFEIPRCVYIRILSYPHTTLDVIEYLIKSNIEFFEYDWDGFLSIWRNPSFNGLWLKTIIKIVQSVQSIKLTERLSYSMHQLLNIKIKPGWLKIIFTLIPDLDLSHRGYFRETLLFNILNTSVSCENFTQIIQEIKQCAKYTNVSDCIENLPLDDYDFQQELTECVNKIAGENLRDDHSNQKPNPIVLLVELCPELFLLIRPRFLTQTLCNEYYSSNHWKIKGDYSSIPEKFHLKLANTKSGSKTKVALRVQYDN